MCKLPLVALPQPPPSPPPPSPSQTNSIVAFPTNPAATSNPVASSNCGFDAAQGYQSATNGGSCFIRDASNMPIVVDYTAFRYTTYSFTIQMLENGQTPTKNNNIGPHGGIKICNKDGTRQTRGSSPEFRFIDRTSDFGYTPDTLRWIRTDDFAYATAEMRSVSEGLWPDAPRVWEIVMEWDGASYKLVSWNVDGTAIPSIAGRISGCHADTSAAGQVRVWSYNSADTFKVKDFTVTQGGPLPPASPPPSPSCLSVEGTNANLNGQYEHQSTATGIPIARYQKGEKGDCDWHYQDVGARSAIGVEACADACEAETLCEKFTYGEGNIGSGGRTSLGCRISTCGSDPGPSPCPSDGTCPLTLQWGGDVYTMATKAAASQHHYTRTDGSMVIRTGDGGWNFCAASGGVVVEPCYGRHGRSGYVGDVQNQPAASEIYDWGHSGDSFISFGC